MTKRFFIIVMMLCASFFSYAQVEQASQELAEKQHKVFASELSNSLKSGKGKPIFGREGNDKQFLLVDEEPFFTEYLGWKRSQFEKRSLSSVYQSLLAVTKHKDARKKVSVNITFPLNDTEFLGQATNKSGKAIKDVYVVTTTAEVEVEATKQDVMESVTKNVLTLNWEVLVSLNKKTGAVDPKSSRAVLRSISAEPAPGGFIAEKPQPKVEPAPVTKPEPAPAPEPVRVTRPEPTPVTPQPAPVTKPEPAPAPAPVVTKPEPAPVTRPAPVAQPVVREQGKTYKVQIYSTLKYTALSELPKRFRMDNVTIEKYVVGGATYYKYVVPAGTTLSEAFAVRRQIRSQGIEDAWIAVYENGVRVSPNEGTPEFVK